VREGGGTDWQEEGESNEVWRETFFAEETIDTGCIMRQDLMVLWEGSGIQILWRHYEKTDAFQSNTKHQALRNFYDILYNRLSS